MVSVVAGNASATVSFTAPANNGGSPITGYTVRVVNAAGAQVGALRPAGTATSLVVTGLTNGQAYRFQVSATSAVGTSAFSALSAAVTPAAPNTAPTVTARAPAVNATVVGQAANVTATFSEAVNGVGTATFQLRTPAGAVVPATVTRNGTTNQWILNPNANLLADTRYTATLTGGTAAIRDVAGAPLVTTSWSPSSPGPGRP